MRQFIERNLGANDLMAVVHTGGRTDAAQEFTSTKRLLLAAVDKFMGRKLVSATVARNEQYFRQLGAAPAARIADPDEQERAFNAQSTMRSLKEIAEWLSGLRGRRKTIIYVSEGIDYDITDVIRQYDAPSNSASMLIDDIRQTINAAARSNVAIYAIDPRGLTDLGDMSIGVAGFADVAAGESRRAGGRMRRASACSGLRNELFLSQMNLRALAEETNGYAAVNSNDFTGAFDRIVRDNSSYYVLAYYPAQNRRDGKFHRIQVRVSRPGVTVRARRGYIAPRVQIGVGPSHAGRRRLGGRHRSARTARSQVSGLAMRVFAAPFKGTAPNASVLFGVEMSGRDLSLDNGAKVEIAYFAVDASGKTRGGQHRDGHAEPAARKQGARRGERPPLPQPHGSAAGPVHAARRRARRDRRQASARSSYDLEVPDFSKSAFSMSGLALTSMSGSALMTARPDEQTKGAAAGAADRAAHVPAERRDRAASPRSTTGRRPAARRRHHGDRPLGRRHGGVQERGRAPIERAAGRERRLRLPGAHSADRSSSPGLYVLTLEAGRGSAITRRRRRQVPFRITAPATGGARFTQCTQCTGAPGAPGCAGRCKAEQGAMRMLDRGSAEQHRRARGRLSSGPRRSGARSGSSMRRERPLPAVDFAREVGGGGVSRERPTGGYGVEIVGAAPKAGALVVQYRETKPGADAIAAQVITSPFHLVAMPKVGRRREVRKAFPEPLRLLRRIGRRGRRWLRRRRGRLCRRASSTSSVAESVVGFGASSLFTFTGLIVPLACLNCR